MKRSIYVRFSLTLLLVLSMLSPMAVLAGGDGKKHFKEGMKQEYAEQWDKAAEAFALAVADNPKNPEYRLHLQRALFNASQMYMKKGNTAAAEKDYQGAYIAFRKAFAFDPVNELAKSEMARMLRLQEESRSPDASEPKSSDGKVKLVQTGYSPGPAADVAVPQKLEQIRQVQYPSGVNLQYIVKELAKDLDLNVLFDADSRLETRRIFIDLKNVTSAKALDYIFLQENLFFQKVGPRTILVALGNRRMNFQQLVLRTFYLSNAAPADVKAMIAAAIPAQPGRNQTIVLEDKSTNSVTVRDTSENIRIIGQLIDSIDKDRAEVVMDVSIYEVNKADLLQFGNQIGTAGQGGTLTNIGGIQLPFAHAGTTQSITSGLPFKGIDLASIALGLPLSSIAALQSKNDTKLLASTQIHAFNNEDSSARIGQRVPVRTATIQGANNTQSGFVSDVINYEQVGLTLKFTPIVFPNQDVQVKMEIESKDVAGAGTLTPTFTERKITGTARIQNNKTLLLASVAQDTETNGRQGLPLLGLIPILGRLFTAPTKDNRKVDIVIAITPRVIRAPAILPEDLIERPTGSQATPTSGSLEAMIMQDERDEMLASARRLPTAINVQLPDQPSDAPTYIRKDTGNAKVSEKTISDASAETKASDGLNVRPIDTGLKTLQIEQTSDTSAAKEPLVEPAPIIVPSADRSDSSPTARLILPQELPVLKRGEKAKVLVNVNSSAAFRSAVLGLRFDDKKLAVRSVSFGDIFGSKIANTDAPPFLNEKGKMFVSLSLPEGVTLAPNGTLAVVEIEALADGKVELSLEKNVLNLLAADGRNFAMKF